MPPERKGIINVGANIYSEFIDVGLIYIQNL